MAKAYSLDLRKKVIFLLLKVGAKGRHQDYLILKKIRFIDRFALNKSGNLAPKKRTDFPKKVPLDHEVGVDNRLLRTHARSPTWTKKQISPIKKEHVTV